MERRGGGGGGEGRTARGGCHHPSSFAHHYRYAPECPRLLKQGLGYAVYLARRIGDLKMCETMKKKNDASGYWQSGSHADTDETRCFPHTMTLPSAKEREEDSISVGICTFFPESISFRKKCLHSTR